MLYVCKVESIHECNSIEVKMCIKRVAAKGAKKTWNGLIFDKISLLQQTRINESGDEIADSIRL